MQFRLLGPVEVEDEGRPLVLGSAKQRALLAILLLHANEVVSRDRLIDDLWGERPPASAPHSLEVYVSRLRKTLQPDGGERLLVTRPGGYLLRLEPDQLDLDASSAWSRKDAARSPPATTSERRNGFAEALALWRGPALGDLAYEPFARPEVERLEEQRLAALEERIEAELALGRHAALIGELEAVSGKHPLRERLHGQLMLALYRCGRQADALETYRDTTTAPARRARDRSQPGAAATGAGDPAPGPCARVGRSARRRGRPANIARVESAEAAPAVDRPLAPGVTRGRDRWAFGRRRRRRDRALHGKLRALSGWCRCATPPA